MDQNKRILFFQNANEFADRHSTNVCGFDMLKKRLGTESKYGEVFQADLKYRTSPVHAAVKLMPINMQNLHEIEYYVDFNKLVISNINPHFPLVFFSKTCKQCPFRARNVADCYVIMKEFANGDLKTWLKSYHSVQEHLSYLAQIAIVIIGLTQKRVIHNDLHWGNMLFHKTPKNNMDRYMYYTVDGHQVYIKMKGYHWVVWDFGLSKKYSSSRPTKNAFSIDLHRICGVVDWVNDRESSHKPLPSSIIELYDAIDDTTEAARNTTTPSDGVQTAIYFLLYTLKPYMDYIDNTILIIDPTTPPEHVINPDQPYNVTSAAAAPPAKRRKRIPTQKKQLM